MNEMYFEKTGLLVPKILLPKPGTDMSRWAVIACDQFTSAGDYWASVEETVGDAASTLNLFKPEYYLEHPSDKFSGQRISENIDLYLKNVFSEVGPGLILVKRTLRSGLVRTGVVCALDLEKYDYNKGSQTLIRPTEGTVLSRIPPRVQIRSGAGVELPHIIMLINDPGNTCLPIIENSESKDKLYDFRLMEDGGQVSGRLISEPEIIEDFNRALEGLIRNNLLFAVGDGNHSFAAAKKHWENLKAKGCDMHHPARFCLCELENIYDSGNVFEPIHRVVFDVDIELFEDLAAEYFGEFGSIIECEDTEITGLPENHEAYHEIKVCGGGRVLTVYIDRSFDPLAVGAIQRFLDESLAFAKIDYIHDLKDTLNIAGSGNNIAIILPCPEKASVFEVAERGEVLPRKTFSMGEARDKRYYIEARKIVR